MPEDANIYTSEYRLYLPDKKELQKKLKEWIEEGKILSFAFIPAEDIDRNAKYLGITLEQFVETYLQKEKYGMNYQTRHKPCDYLQEDGKCKWGDCKPDSCKKYPYTDQPDRISSLLSILDTIEICPVAFEIFERLKEEYGFRTRR